MKKTNHIKPNGFIRGILALVAAFILFLLMVNVMRYTSNVVYKSDQHTVEEIKKNPMSTTIYPNADVLNYAEQQATNKNSKYQLGPEIVYYYGTSASSEEVLNFYTQQAPFEKNGWSQTGLFENKELFVYELTYLHADMAMIIEIWKKESFLEKFPTLKENAEKYTTLVRQITFMEAVE